MASDYGKSLYNDYETLLLKYEKITEENKILKKEHALLEQERRLRQRLEKELSGKKQEIETLKKEILRLNGFLNTDGNNSGLPTSRTPIQKKKRIPNSREKSGRTIGGQPGHPRAKLERFAEEEITEHVEHPLDTCPECGGKMEALGDDLEKDELDYEVVVVKKRHHFRSFRCKDCGQIYRQTVPGHLKEENQYGGGAKSLMLLLMNTGNVSVNKVRKMICGLSQGEMNPSEGYIIKQQKKAALALEGFLEELKQELLRLDILFWDDTVIMVSTARGCLRFYGNEKLALYKAHRHKNKEGLDNDGILPLLPAETTVMHDHNKVNYNEAYSFNNIECNAHLLRDLQKIADNLPGHQWPGDLRGLINETNKARTEAETEGKSGFDDEYIEKFFQAFNRIMLKAIEENKGEDNYYGNEERKLINRITDYKDNYFAWVANFEFPFTNNLSERSLRGAKSKMKISGQFQTIEYAGHYAAIKSYIETCYRNGINEHTALRRLCEGNPYTISEILAGTAKKE